jgi:ABC-2 type transport system permease protein
MSFGETFSYIVFAQCIYCIYPSSTSNIIGELMKNGNISLYMVKPISIFRRFIFEQIGTSIYKFIFLALPTLAIAWLFFGVSVGRPDMLIILAILIFSYLFYFTFEMIIGCLSFITKSIWGIQSLKFTVLLLLTGRIIPLDFYPTSIQKVITKLPFRFFFASLADSISRNVSFSIYDFLELTATVILSIIIYIVIFSLACRHFTVQGG